MTWFGLAYPSCLVVFVALWGEPEWFMWLNVAIIMFFSALWILITLKGTQRIKELKALLPLRKLNPQQIAA